MFYVTKNTPYLIYEKNHSVFYCSTVRRYILLKSKTSKLDAGEKIEKFYNVLEAYQELWPIIPLVFSIEEDLEFFNMVL